MRIELLMTGNELMSGVTVDSNSALIARTLEPLGLRIGGKVTVGDDDARIRCELLRLAERCEVLIVNGEKEIEPGKNQNSLTDANVARMAKAVSAFADEELFCKVVTLAEIRDNDHNLNITRYVQTDPPPEGIDVKAEVAKLQELLGERDAAEARMMGFLRELGYVR